MWRWLLSLCLVLLLAACGSANNNDNNDSNNNVNDNNEQNENKDEDNDNELNSEDLNINNEDAIDNMDIDTTTADGYDRLTFKYMMDDIIAEKADLDDFEAVIEDPDYLQYIPFQTEETEIGEIASAMTGNTEDAEDIEAFFAEHTDGDSFIRLALDDEPIRVLSVPTENVPMSSVLNFSSHVIRYLDGETIKIDEKEEEYWLDYMISLRSEETQDASDDEFRSWDELSNIEQTYLPVFGKTTELLYQLVAFEAFDYMDSDAAQLILEQLALLGDEAMMFPEPQTSLDYAMYNNIVELKPYWSYLGNSNPEDPEYTETLEKVFNFSNDAGFQMNQILYTEHEEFLGADLYIDAYNDM